jgi:ABC-type thiamine transport system ATPase subunit
LPCWAHLAAEIDPAAAGFEQPTAGQIMLDGVDLARVPPYQRLSI